MVQVVLPNDANPMGFMLGGAVMHLIDIAGAIAALRHARTVMVTGTGAPFTIVGACDFAIAALVAKSFDDD